MKRVALTILSIVIAITFHASNHSCNRMVDFKFSDGTTYTFDTGHNWCLVKMYPQEKGPHIYIYDDNIYLQESYAQISRIYKKLYWELTARDPDIVTSMTFKQDQGICEIGLSKEKVESVESRID